MDCREEIHFRDGVEHRGGFGFWSQVVFLFMIAFEWYQSSCIINPARRERISTA